MGCATGPENNKNKPTTVSVLVFFIATVLTTCLYASYKFTFLRNAHLHICVYSGGTQRVCRDLWKSKNGQKQDETALNRV